MKKRVILNIKNIISIIIIILLIFIAAFIVLYNNSSTTINLKIDLKNTVNNDIKTFFVDASISLNH